MYIPTGGTFAFDTIERWAADDHKVAMLWLTSDGTQRHITFAAFAARSNQLANGLTSLGIHQGDRVLVMLPQLPQWWEAVLAIMKIGAVAVPCTPHLSPTDITYRANAALAAAIITDQANASTLELVRPATPTLRRFVLVGDRRDGWTDFETLAATHSIHYARNFVQVTEPCLLIFSADAGRYPKMVVHDQAYPLSQLSAAQDGLALQPSHLFYDATENGWAEDSGNTLFAPWLVGATFFVPEMPGPLSSQDMLHLLSYYPITTFCAPSLLWQALVQQDLTNRHFPALRHALVAGGLLEPEMMARWQAATGLPLTHAHA